MANKSFYLSSDELKFADKYLNNFNDWIKDELRDAMEHTPEFCQKNIDFHSDKVTKWKLKLKEAEKVQTKKNSARKILTAEYKKRISIDLKKGFLSGNKGQRLLRDSGITMNRFMGEMEG